MSNSYDLLHQNILVNNQLQSNNMEPPKINKEDKPELELPKEELQKYVKQWITYDDEIKALQQAIKERKKLKNDIGDVVLNFMDNNKIPHFNLNDGKLIFSKSQQTQPVNLNYLKETLPKCNILDQKQYQELFEYIQNNREKKIKTQLKRTRKHEKTNDSK